MREFCLECRKARVTCYCALLRPFETEPLFVILTHPREMRNPVGTGRMLHRSIRGSLLIDGHDFTDEPRITALLRDAALHCALLYPGREALDLSSCAREQAVGFTPPGKRLALIIVDGTWDLARGMINRSACLRALPQLRFTPDSQSRYRIREQPGSHCLSTLETAHWMIERLADLGVSQLPAARAHDGLLEVFDAMVEQQLTYAAESSGRTDGIRSRHPSVIRALTR